MTRPAYDPTKTYQLKETAFPFLSTETVDANVVTIEDVDATDAIQTAAAAAIAAAGLATAATATAIKAKTDLIPASPATLPKQTEILEAIAELDVVPLTAVGSAPAAGTLTIRRGDTVALEIASLASQLQDGESWSDVEQIWFGGKVTADDADDDALIIADDDTGLIVCNGDSGDDLTSSQTATITVTDETDGDISVTISAAATAAMLPRAGAVWDVQVKTSSGVYTLAAGTLVVTADVVRRVT
jgi:hypothetical protein